MVASVYPGRAREGASDHSRRSAADEPKEVRRRRGYPRWWGLDVPKKTMTACVLIREAAGNVQYELRRVGTMTRDVLALADWLPSAQVTQGTMESTGVDWKPVWNILAGQVAVVLVNAHHSPAVPGRKTARTDCQWIADRLQHGLLRGHFVPPPSIRRWRDLTRVRTS